MSYAEVHLLSLKELPEIQTLESLMPRKMSFSAEELTTVPVALARKYLYLYKRYAFADRVQMIGMEEYQPGATSPHLWAPILNQAEVKN
jgi:hypothetical protein